MAKAKGAPAEIAEQAFACIKRGDYDEALSLYGRLAGGPLEDSTLQSNVGFALWQKGDYAQARAALVASLEQDPDNLEARINLTDLCLIESRNERWRTKYFQSSVSR